MLNYYFEDVALCGEKSEHNKWSKSKLDVQRKSVADALPNTPIVAVDIVLAYCFEQVFALREDAMELYKQYTFITSLNIPYQFTASDLRPWVKSLRCNMYHSDLDSHPNIEKLSMFAHNDRIEMTDKFPQLNGENFPKLTSIAINGNKFPSMDWLRNFPHLEQLTFRNCRISQNSLNWLEFLPNLRKLNISSCRVTDVTGLQHVKELTDLSILNMTSIGQEIDLTMLRQLKQCNIQVGPGCQLIKIACISMTMKKADHISIEVENGPIIE